LDISSQTFGFRDYKRDNSLRFIYLFWSLNPQCLKEAFYLLIDLIGHDQGLAIRSALNTF
jgi:hypothetical protein